MISRSLRCRGRLAEPEVARDFDSHVMGRLVIFPYIQRATALEVSLLEGGGHIF